MSHAFLNTDEQVSWLLRRAVKGTVLQVATYSFVPEGWVVTMLKRCCASVYIGGPFSLTQMDLLRTQYPNATFVPISSSHAKVFAISYKREVALLVTSMNFVPTSNIEYGYVLEGDEAANAANRVFKHIDKWKRDVPNLLHDRYEHIL